MIPAPDIATAIERAAQREVESEVDLATGLSTHRKQFELTAAKDHHSLRLRFCGRIFWLMVAWLLFVATVTSLSALTASGFHLSDNVIIALLTSTTLNVIGLFTIVAKWMFPKT